MQQSNTWDPIVVSNLVVTVFTLAFQLLKKLVKLCGHRSKDDETKILTPTGKEIIKEVIGDIQIVTDALNKK